MRQEKIRPNSFGKCFNERFCQSVRLAFRTAGFRSGCAGEASGGATTRRCPRCRRSGPGDLAAGGFPRPARRGDAVPEFGSVAVPEVIAPPVRGIRENAAVALKQRADVRGSGHGRRDGEGQRRPAEKGAPAGAGSGFLPQRFLKLRHVCGDAALVRGAVAELLQDLGSGQHALGDGVDAGGEPAFRFGEEAAQISRRRFRRMRRCGGRGSPGGRLAGRRTRAGDSAVRRGRRQVALRRRGRPLASAEFLFDSAVFVQRRTFPSW